MFLNYTNTRLSLNITENVFCIFFSSISKLLAIFKSIAHVDKKVVID